MDLARLSQRLAPSPLVPELDPPIYCGDACYLAELLDYFPQVASSLRSELKASPLAHNARLMALIERLAVGNAVAERVLQETRNEPQRATTDPAGGVARLLWPGPVLDWACDSAPKLPWPTHQSS